MTISPADQIANDLMFRALHANADFEMAPDLTLDPETEAMLDDTEQLLEVRRGNLYSDGKKKELMRTRGSSSLVGRKLAFAKGIPEEDMDTN